MMATRADVGRLYVWTYLENRKNYPGGHLAAEDAECMRLADAIESLSIGSRSDPLIFAVSAVTRAVLAVPNNGHAKARSARELRVVAAGEPRHFWLDEQNGILTITAGREGLDELRKNIIGITETDGGCVEMGPDDDRASEDHDLWFWWLAP